MLGLGLGFIQASRNYECLLKDKQHQSSQQFRREVVEATGAGEGAVAVAGTGTRTRTGTGAEAGTLERSSAEAGTALVDTRRRGEIPFRLAVVHVLLITALGLVGLMLRVTNAFG
jgi:hypothetical protein